MLGANNDVTDPSFVMLNIKCDVDAAVNMIYPVFSKHLLLMCFKPSTTNKNSNSHIVVFASDSSYKNITIYDVSISNSQIELNRLPFCIRLGIHQVECKTEDDSVRFGSSI